MNESGKEVLHVINLCFHNHEKRLNLVGENSDAGKQRYLEARKGMNVIGDKCKDWPEFLEATIEHFKKFGFTQVKE